MCSLAPLVKKVHESRVVEIVESLCQKLLTGKEQQRDIASIALKTVVAEISSGNVAQCVVVSLTPKLIKGITYPVCPNSLFQLMYMISSVNNQSLPIWLKSSISGS